MLEFDVVLWILMIGLVALDIACSVIYIIGQKKQGAEYITLE